ncbi:hypothetical protein K505DRAFT_410596 [Melanomma pulvis-pyrius CBS 109.77]|uniref:Glycoside hydrolase family 43 protein n=1 Tax=Melanomma pulvis-pyrius CBS 109.77 TaxID=1314802 RepID=A0A6A6WYC2_9PLEO|nr:hypothetical protein K505DRAFT_410596 [Melanomma pulvis-pyrius CBS 109.77]
MTFTPLFNMQTPALLAIVIVVNGQDNLGLANGYTAFQTKSIQGQIVRSSQTLASLNSSSSNFNFLPFDILSRLAFNGAHHLGDVTFRYRTSGSSAWTSVDSASARKPVTVMSSSLKPNLFAAADLAPTLPRNLPFLVTREWLQYEDDFAMRINITNTAKSIAELGSLGLPVSINNIFTGRTAEQTQDRCSLADPYVGLDAGYVRVSHLRGTGKALVITPLGSTPLEAWRFLKEPQGNYGYQSQTFEGNYEWQVHSIAWAQNEWRNSTPWNAPTFKTLQPGELYSIGLRFSIAENIQKIENAVVKTKTPLAVGIPGYVVPSDSSTQLYLNHSSAVKNVDVGGAFTISAPSSPGGPYKLTPIASAWGRIRVTISYEDAKTQTVHYFITKPAPSTLAKLGRFFTTSAHYTNIADPFGRAPSIMTYDRETNKIVDQDPRVWISGISDEGGTGAYLATAMKQFAQPVAREVSILDDFIHDTVIGTLQQNGSLGVVASAFFYEPGAANFSYNPIFDWQSWTSWNRERAYTTRRAYNYIHPVATYWAMYRVARDYPEQKLRASWEWYLGRAVNTTQYCLSNRAKNCDYGLVGLMGEWVLGELLEDLKREGKNAQVSALETTMRYRAERWETETVPFGSEMAWDSTGQEGVYFWTRYFSLPSTPAKTLNSIIAYMPAIAHWGWNGNARRYWDFVYGAKIQQIERQIHHYGSALNSLPLLHDYELNPTNNLYALRVGYAGNFAPLTNIDDEGFASAAFHSFPELLKWDPYSGDYGQGFLGMSLGQTTYITSDQLYGDLSFGGHIDYSNSTMVETSPKDAIRRRVFVAALALKIEISAGAVQTVVYDKTVQSVTLTIVDAVASDALKASSAIVWLKRPGSITAGFSVAGARKERLGWVVNLSSGTAKVRITKL